MMKCLKKDLSIDKTRKTNDLQRECTKQINKIYQEYELMQKEYEAAENEICTFMSSFFFEINRKIKEKDI